MHTLAFMRFLPTYFDPVIVRVVHRNPAKRHAKPVPQDEIPVRPDEGRLSASFCPTADPYFAPGKNRDNGSGLFDADVKSHY